MASTPKIVVVEEDFALRASLEFSLHLQGFEVEAFASGDALLRLGRWSDASCWVIDHRLSQLDGLSLLTELRRVNSTIPAIILASNPTKKLHEQVEGAGAILIEKPLISDSLIDCLRKVTAHEIGG